MVGYVHDGNAAGLRSRLDAQAADIEKTAKVNLKAKWGPDGEKRQFLADNLNIFLAAQADRVKIDSLLLSLGSELAAETAKQAAAKAAVSDIKKILDKTATEKRDCDKRVKEQMAVLLTHVVTVVEKTGRRAARQGAIAASKVAVLAAVAQSQIKKRKRS